MTDQQTAADNALIEVERDAEGHVLMCTGCGTVETIRSIKARKPKAFSCCPERKMVRPTTEAAERIKSLLAALGEQK